MPNNAAVAAAGCYGKHAVSTAAISVDAAATITDKFTSDQPNQTMKTAIQKTILVLSAFVLVAQAKAFQNTEVGEFAERDRNEPNLYAFVGNNPVNSLDPFGLWATDVHHQIVLDWLTDNKYGKYPWRCCNINVRAELMEGSDEIDGDVGWGLTLANPGFYSAQSSANAYQHAMKNMNQTVAQAQALYNQFLNDHIQRARDYAAKARTRQSGGGWDCAFMVLAIRELGMSYHAYSDSLSPAHSGFQTWYGPWDGYLVFGAKGYWDYVHEHKAKETMQVYKGMKGQVVGPVQGQFQGTLDDLLKP